MWNDYPFMRKLNEKKEDTLRQDPFFKPRNYQSNMLGNLGLLPKAPVQYDSLVRASKESEASIAAINDKLNFLIRRQDAADRANARYRSRIAERPDRPVDVPGHVQHGRLPPTPPPDAARPAPDPVEERQLPDGDDSGGGVVPPEGRESEGGEGTPGV